MSALLRNIRFALRVLWSSPGFTAVAMLTLGLGIACTTTVFSWIDTVLVHPYPGTARSGELAVFEMVTRSAPNGGTNISWPDYRDYRDGMTTLAGVAVRRQAAFTLGEGTAPRLAWGELVSLNYFEVMGVKPLLGGFFANDDRRDALDGYPAVVISEALWRSYFRSDPRVAGKTVRINRQPMTIAGVAAGGFRGSSPVMRYDLWAPVTMGPALGLMPTSSFIERGDRGYLQAVCRVRSGGSAEQSRAEAGAMAARLAETYPRTNQGVGATVLPPWEAHNGVNEYLRRPLAILLAVSVVVLLIVCANVANLLMARSVARQREFAIRMAMGAGRGRVAAQVLTETMVLAAAGAGVGLLLLLWMQGSLLAMVPSVGFPLSAGVAINGRILAFTALACVAAALVSGASPALFVAHANLNRVLQDGGRGDTTGRGSRRTRNVLVAVEVALATVALVGSGLFVRSFRNIRAIHPGFEGGHVLLGRFFIETAGFTPEQAQQFPARLKERLLAMPGIEAVSYSDFVPLSTTAGPYNGVRVDGYTPAQGESTATNRAKVSPDYFATMRIPLVEGRDFRVSDDETAEPAMIVNQAFAKRFFYGQSPVGRRVRAGGKWWTVVGMARDAKYFSPAEAQSPYFYLPFRQAYASGPELYLLARTTGAPADAAALLRRAVAEVDRNASAVHTVGLAEYTEVSTFGQKVAATLMGALGLMCLVLAGSGLYGVMSYTVSQRVPEMGIRMAMGASPARVIGLVVGQGMTLTLAGMAAGAAVALGTTRLVASMLIGVGAADPWSFVLAGVFLAAVALVATWAPAWRMTRGDPMGALRGRS
jgi:predicted permease